MEKESATALVQPQPMRAGELISPQESAGYFLTVHLSLLVFVADDLRSSFSQWKENQLSASGCRHRALGGLHPSGVELNPTFAWCEIHARENYPLPLVAPAKTQGRNAASLLSHLGHSVLQL